MSLVAGSSLRMAGNPNPKVRHFFYRRPAARSLYDLVLELVPQLDPPKDACPEPPGRPALPARTGGAGGPPSHVRTVRHHFPGSGHPTPATECPPPRAVGVEQPDPCRHARHK